MGVAENFFQLHPLSVSAHQDSNTWNWIITRLIEKTIIQKENY